MASSKATPAKAPAGKASSSSTPAASSKKPAATPSVASANMMRKFFGVASPAVAPAAAPSSAVEEVPSPAVAAASSGPSAAPAPPPPAAVAAVAAAAAAETTAMVEPAAPPAEADSAVLLPAEAKAKAGGSRSRGRKAAVGAVSAGTDGGGEASADAAPAVAAVPKPKKAASKPHKRKAKKGASDDEDEDDHAAAEDDDDEVVVCASTPRPSVTFTIAPTKVAGSGGPTSSWGALFGKPVKASAPATAASDGLNNLVSDDDDVVAAPASAPAPASQRASEAAVTIVPPRTPSAHSTSAASAWSTLLRPQSGAGSAAVSARKADRDRAGIPAGPAAWHLLEVPMQGHNHVGASSSAVAAEALEFVAFPPETADGGAGGSITAGASGGHCAPGSVLPDIADILRTAHAASAAATAAEETSESYDDFALLRRPVPLAQSQVQAVAVSGEWRAFADAVANRLNTDATWQKLDAAYSCITSFSAAKAEPQAAVTAPVVQQLVSQALQRAYAEEDSANKPSSGSSNGSSSSSNRNAVSSSSDGSDGSDSVRATRHTAADACFTVTSLLGGTHSAGAVAAADASHAAAAQFDSAWVQKHRPLCAAAVCGNAAPVADLASWLVRWREASALPEDEYQRLLDAAAAEAAAAAQRRARPIDADSSSDDADSDDEGGKSTRRRKLRAKRHKADSDDDAEHSDASRGGRGRSKRRGSAGSSSHGSASAASLMPLAVLTGPVGCGKTAAVYACAHEAGFAVIEVHPGQDRDKRLLLDSLREATQSRRVRVSAAATTVANAKAAANSVASMFASAKGAETSKAFAHGSSAAEAGAGAGAASGKGDTAEPPRKRARRAAVVSDSDDDESAGQDVAAAAPATPAAVTDDAQDAVMVEVNEKAAEPARPSRARRPNSAAVSVDLPSSESEDDEDDDDDLPAKRKKKQKAAGKGGKKVGGKKGHASTVEGTDAAAPSPAPVPAPAPVRTLLSMFGGSAKPPAAAPPAAANSKSSKKEKSDASSATPAKPASQQHSLISMLGAPKAKRASGNGDTNAAAVDLITPQKAEGASGSCDGDVSVIDISSSTKKPAERSGKGKHAASTDAADDEEDVVEPLNDAHEAAAAGFLAAVQSAKDGMSTTVAAQSSHGHSNTTSSSAVVALDDDTVMVSSSSAPTSQPAAGTSSESALTLILFEAADVLFAGTDRGFLDAIRELSEETRCPIVITANKLPIGKVFAPIITLPFFLLPFARPQPSLLAAHLLAVAAAEGAALSFVQVAQLVLDADCDIRKAFNALQFARARLPLPPAASLPHAVQQEVQAARSRLATLLTQARHVVEGSWSILPYAPAASASTSAAGSGSAPARGTSTAATISVDDSFSSGATGSLAAPEPIAAISSNGSATDNATDNSITSSSDVVCVSRSAPPPPPTSAPAPELPRPEPAAAATAMPPAASPTGDVLINVEAAIAAATPATAPPFPVQLAASTAAPGAEAASGRPRRAAAMAATDRMRLMASGFTIGQLEVSAAGHEADDAEQDGRGRRRRANERATAGGAGKKRKRAASVSSESEVETTKPQRGRKRKNVEASDSEDDAVVVAGDGGRGKQRARSAPPAVRVSVLPSAMDTAASLLEARNAQLALKLKWAGPAVMVAVPAVLPDPSAALAAVSVEGACAASVTNPTADSPVVAVEPTDAAPSAVAASASAYLSAVHSRRQVQLATIEPPYALGNAAEAAYTTVVLYGTGFRAVPPADVHISIGGVAIPSDSIRVKHDRAVVVRVPLELLHGLLATAVDDYSLPYVPLRLPRKALAVIFQAAPQAASANVSRVPLLLLDVEVRVRGVTATLPRSWLWSPEPATELDVSVTLATSDVPRAVIQVLGRALKADRKARGAPPAATPAASRSAAKGKRRGGAGAGSRNQAQDASEDASMGMVTAPTGETSGTEAAESPIADTGAEKEEGADVELQLDFDVEGDDEAAADSAPATAGVKRKRSEGSEQDTDVAIVLSEDEDEESAADQVKRRRTGETADEAAVAHEEAPSAAPTAPASGDADYDPWIHMPEEEDDPDDLQVVPASVTPSPTPSAEEAAADTAALLRLCRAADAASSADVLLLPRGNIGTSASPLRGQPNPVLPLPLLAGYGSNGRDIGLQEVFELWEGRGAALQGGLGWLRSDSAGAMTACSFSTPPVSLGLHAAYPLADDVAAYLLLAESGVGASRPWLSDYAGAVCSEELEAGAGEDDDEGGAIEAPAKASALSAFGFGPAKPANGGGGEGGLGSSDDPPSAAANQSWPGPSHEHGDQECAAYMAADLMSAASLLQPVPLHWASLWTCHPMLYARRHVTAVSGAALLRTLVPGTHCHGRGLALPGAFGPAVASCVGREGVVDALERFSCLRGMASAEVAAERQHAAAEAAKREAAKRDAAFGEPLTTGRRFTRSAMQPAAAEATPFDSHLQKHLGISLAAAAGGWGAILLPDSPHIRRQLHVCT